MCFSSLTPPASCSGPSWVYIDRYSALCGGFGSRQILAHPLLFSGACTAILSPFLNKDVVVRPSGSLHPHDVGLLLTVTQSHGHLTSGGSFATPATHKPPRQLPTTATVPTHIAHRPRVRWSCFAQANNFNLPVLNLARPSVSKRGSDKTPAAPQSRQKSMPAPD